jgi:hypothetical protein
MSVLRRARFGGPGTAAVGPAGFSHDGGAGDALDEPTARAIAAFVDLL